MGVAVDMNVDRQHLRRALNVAIRHGYSESALLSARPCDPSVARDQQPDAVLWSWVTVSGAWTGTVAMVQPLELALLVVKQVHRGVKEPVTTDLVLNTQGELTARVVGKTFDQLFGIGTKAVLAPVQVGNGAPDVRRGSWQGHTWSVGGWWAAIFIYEGALAAHPTPMATIANELIPDTDRMTNSQPLTKVFKPSDADSGVEWPEVLPSSIIPKDLRPAIKKAAKPAPPELPRSAPPVPLNPPVAPIANVPPPSDSSTSARRGVVRTIQGLMSPDNAMNQPSSKPPTATTTHHSPAPSKIDVDRTAPWFKAKEVVKPSAGFAVPEVLGHYRIEGVLGEGGMGVVLKAAHTTLNRVVAIKLMKPSLADNPAFAARFMQEARIAASLDHPNLVTVYDAAQEGGFLYMALRFMAGGDLTDQLKREGQLSEPRAIHMFNALLLGLQYLDGKQLIHRDIKPANVLLDSDFTPRLGDLGLMRARTSNADPNDAERMGTPSYMSPEQLYGDRDLDIRSDIYSLGLTLYVALTCQQPLQGEDLEATISNVLNVDPPDPRTMVPAISEAMTQVVMKAIRKRPQDRFQSPKEFLDALASVEHDALNELSASGISWFGKIFGGRR